MLTETMARALIERLGVRKEHLRFGLTEDPGTDGLPLSLVPSEARAWLTLQNAGLLELHRRYAGHPATRHVIWTPAAVTRGLSIEYFRADNMYLWQRRALNTDLAYALTAYYVRLNDRLGLWRTLPEDALFGMYVLPIDDGWVVSRDLLDSILQIGFLSRVLAVDQIRELTILDIGAGYGRMAHRLVAALPNVQLVLCADAVPESTFVCEYYLKFRKVPKALSVPLDELEEVLKKHQVHLATAIHSLSECSLESVEWWIDLLQRHSVPYLVIVPNEVGGPRTITAVEPLPGNRFAHPDLLPLLRRKGYQRVHCESKYHAGSTVHRFGIYPEYFHLFRLG
jgi:hypothetical protein